jgi:LuxR family transcriptional regulator, maltose regulon positive regulatory protein
LSDYFASIHHTAVRIDVLALQALLYQLEGNGSLALATLAEAKRLAEPGGYIRPFSDLGEPLERLLMALARKGAAASSAAGVPEASPAALPHSTDRRLANAALLSPLTQRELEVLALLESHPSDREIAEKLVISLPTVRTHLEHIGEKLGASGRRNMVKAARAQALL